MISIKPAAQRHTSYGIDVPICMDALNRVIAWRDRKVMSWPEDITTYRQIAVKTGVEISLMAILAISVAEFAMRNLFFLILTPLIPFESIRLPAIRTKQSTINTLYTTLFSFESLWHNLVEKCVASKMIYPRLSSSYLEFYKA